jgi:hypothetical protein
MYTWFGGKTNPVLPGVVASLHGGADVNGTVVLLVTHSDGVRRGEQTELLQNHDGTSQCMMKQLFFWSITAVANQRPISNVIPRGDRVHASREVITCMHATRCGHRRSISDRIHAHVQTHSTECNLYSCDASRPACTQICFWQSAIGNPFKTLELRKRGEAEEAEPRWKLQYHCDTYMLCI